MNDAQAMKHLQAGNPGGLEHLVRAYQAQAVRAAFLVIHDRAAAEDVVSSAFLRLCDRAEQFDTTRPFAPWFMRIVVNDAVKSARQRERMVSINGPGRDGAESQAVDARGDDRADPHSRAVLSETRRTVREALAQLGPNQRAAVVMRYFLEMSEAEMAEQTGRTPGTVKRHLHDARKRLKAILGPTTDH